MPKEQSELDADVIVAGGGKVWRNRPDGTAVVIAETDQPEPKKEPGK